MKLKIERREDEGVRVDKYLTNLLSSKESFAKISRGDVVHIALKFVKVNGMEVKPSHRLKLGDDVEINEDEFKRNFEEKKSGFTEIIAEESNLKIVEETDDYIVIDKESGISVHPSEKEHSGTIANYVKGYYGSNLPRAGIVHRLDKPVAGLLIVAKTEAAQRDLMSQFEEHTTLKIYLAEVQNQYRPNEDWQVVLDRVVKDYMSGRELNLDEWMKVEGNIARDPKNRLRMKITEGKGKYVCSYILPINSSQLLILIKTGRMHQIRATIRSLNLEIEGDSLYSFKSATILPERIGLYSVVLGIEGLDGKRKIFNILDRYL